MRTVTVEYSCDRCDYAITYIVTRMEFTYFDASTDLDVTKFGDRSVAHLCTSCAAAFTKWLTTP